MPTRRVSVQGAAKSSGHDPASEAMIPESLQHSPAVTLKPPAPGLLAVLATEIGDRPMPIPSTFSNNCTTKAVTRPARIEP